jgi:periplasmic divalent cation tolerance protein
MASDALSTPGVARPGEGEDGYRVVLTTVASEADARSLAHRVVESRHAACVNIVPGVTSVYEWEDEVHEDAELLLIAKTAEDRVDALIAFVKANHPYTEPEVVALPVERGSRSYLDWVRRQTRS